MKWSAELVALVPTGVTTVMSTVPAEPTGAVAVSWVPSVTATLVAAVEPK